MPNADRCKELCRAAGGSKSVILVEGNARIDPVEVRFRRHQASLRMALGLLSNQREGSLTQCVVRSALWPTVDQTGGVTFML